MPFEPSLEPSEMLDSWKQIAAYLNRDVRTVMRWEQARGMPVHRLPGGAAVYAVKSELDTWRRSGRIHLVEGQEMPEHPVPPGKPARPSLAVLPFANLTAGKENEYFSDGLADEVITVLTRIEGLRVTARTSSFAFRGKEQDVREIGNSLGVEYLLEGSLQRAGDRIRVSAQLVSTFDGFHLWSDSYDHDLTDIFAVQDEIAASIAAALRLRVVPRPRPKVRTANLDAYHAWLKGRHYSFGGRTLQETMAAGECFQQAVALDPDFAAARAEVAQHLLCLVMLGLAPPHQAAIEGRSEIERALELDDLLGEAHAVMGMYRALFDFDWAGAETEFKRAKECEPGSAFILRWHALMVLSPLMRLEQAEAESRESLELDPLCPESHFFMAMMLFFRRQYEQAEASIRNTLELGGRNPFVQWVDGVIAVLQGRSEEAIAKCECALQLYGRVPMLSACLGMVYGLAGKTAEARAVLAQMEQAAGVTYISPIYRAWVHMGLGEKDEAFRWLDRAVDARDPHILHIPAKPAYDGLRGHPHFNDLLRKMRLQDANAET